jgi:hypothetical protein
MADVSQEGIGVVNTIPRSATRNKYQLQLHHSSTIPTDTDDHFCTHKNRKQHKAMNEKDNNES